jgi:hypothetical protein
LSEKLAAEDAEARADGHFADVEELSRKGW